MRRHGTLTFLLLGLLVVNTAQADDFDPRGRKKPKPAPVRPGPARPGPVRPGPGPTAPGPDRGSPALLIERYTRIVLSQPGAPFPLQRLSQLYRERDGNIQALVKDFEARAAATGAEQYASIVTLAGIYKIDGRAAEAVTTYEKAIGMRDTDPVAITALARLHQDRGDLDAARKRYEAALKLQTQAVDKETSLRTIMTLSLDLKDFTRAKSCHTELVNMQKQSLFVRGELGRELFQRAEYERAEAEFKDVVQYATGDNRALAPALKELGKAQAKAKKNKEALATLKRALSTAGSEAAVRAEIYETIAEVYRADQELAILVRELEAEAPNDFARLSLLGSLYEETGDAEKALAAYRKALAVNPRHIDLRVKIIRILQTQGDLERAIAEYDGLIRVAPHNPQFVFEQCDALLQRGDRVRAMAILQQLETRGGSDEEILTRLADFYGRLGEADRSLNVLTRLTQVAANDPAHLVDLGDRYFQDGKHELALQTWRRILVTVTPRARALAALADVYLEHDMKNEALASFKEAVQLEPANPTYKKQLAGAYERNRGFQDALVVWDEIWQKARESQDKSLLRECRNRIATLWRLQKALDAQIPPLEKRFNATPPDVESGRMLAEVHAQLRDTPAAERTLRKVIELAPGDSDAYLALERVLVQGGKLGDAIAVLEKLLEVEPKRARELYQRMSTYARDVYKDDDAIKYAARAVELNPDDAEGHRRLGEMYKSRNDADRAIAEFRAAIQRNDRLFPVYFTLADLLVARAQFDEADKLLRRVVRAAPDEELITRAARQSAQLNLGRGTLESLEQELLPLAIGNPQRSVYRRLLIDIYGTLTFSLVERVRSGSPEEAKAAGATLSRIGQRAIKPLLDALSDPDLGEQRIAIDVLSHVGSRAASLPLFAYATGSAELSLRVRAMLACAALRDPRLLPKLRAVVFPIATDDEPSTEPVAVAATWALATMGERTAGATLKRIVTQGTPEMRAYAILGLGALHEKTAVEAIREAAFSEEAGTVARAAAAYTLGELGGERERAALVTLSEGSDPLLRRTATIALARLSTRVPSALPFAREKAIEALFSPTASRSRTRGKGTVEGLSPGAAALAIIVGAKATPTELSSVAPSDVLDAESVLERLLTTEASVATRSTALVRHRAEIQAAAHTAMATSLAGANAVLDATVVRGGLEPLITADETAEIPDARAAASAIFDALVPDMVRLSRHPDDRLRAKAVLALVQSGAKDADAALSHSLTDGTESVQRAVLSQLGSYSDARIVATVRSVAEKHANWAIRALALEALGRLGSHGEHDTVVNVLGDRARRDPYALVRERALTVLAALDPKAASVVARERSTKEEEPAVRATAKKLAQ